MNNESKLLKEDGSMVKNRKKKLQNSAVVDMMRYREDVHDVVPSS